ncbi:MAG: acyltransferase [Candidatus Bathyarchaeia archaeon]
MKRLRLLLRHLALVTGYVAKGNVYTGRNVHIGCGAVISTTKKGLIALEDNVEVGEQSKIYAEDGVTVHIRKYASIGSGCVIKAQHSLCSSTFFLDVNATVGENCMIDLTGNVKIGAGSVLSSRCYVHTHKHLHDGSRPLKYQEIMVQYVEIGKNCWLGTGVQVLGASIGDGAVVGAGSIVTHDIPAFCVAVGAPAKIIGGLE